MRAVRKSAETAKFTKTAIMEFQVGLDISISLDTPPMAWYQKG